MRVRVNGRLWVEAVVSSFDADGSGQVDTAEFSSLLNEHISRAQQGSGKFAGGAGSGEQEGNAESGGGGDGGDGGRMNKGPRDGRAVIGLQWDTSGNARGKGGGDKAEAAVTAAPASSSEGVEQHASVGIGTSRNDRNDEIQLARAHLKRECIRFRTF